MANTYMNLYKGNPTAGGTDGTLVSLDGVGTSPVQFTLDASQAESATQPVAVRCESGYEVDGNVTVSASGTNAARWSFCDTAAGTYTTSISLAGVDDTNKVFYVKADSLTSESPGADQSVKIDVSATVVPSA